MVGVRLWLAMVALAWTCMADDLITTPALEQVGQHVDDPATALHDPATALHDPATALHDPATTLNDSAKAPPAANDDASPTTTDILALTLPSNQQGKSGDEKSSNPVDVEPGSTVLPEGTQYPDDLPTQLPETTTTADPRGSTVDTSLKKKPSVPKKGAVYEDKSSVPKKGAVYDDKPSVPKKGADPLDLKPSVLPRKDANPSNTTAEIVSDSQGDSKVVPRKEADPSAIKPSVYARKEATPNNTSVMSEASMQSGTSEPSLQSDKAPMKALGEGKVASDKGKDEGKLIDTKEKGQLNVNSGAPLNLIPTDLRKPMPTLVSKDNSTSAPQPIIKPSNLTEFTTTTETPTTTEPHTTSEPHGKPTAAIDDLNAPTDEDDGHGSYAPVAVAVVLLVCIVVTVMVLALRKLQDVWMKRHYARMDFLIDGMYDM